MAWTAAARRCSKTAALASNSALACCLQARAKDAAAAGIVAEGTSSPRDRETEASAVRHTSKAVSSQYFESVLRGAPHRLRWRIGRLFGCGRGIGCEAVGPDVESHRREINGEGRHPHQQDQHECDEDQRGALFRLATGVEEPPHRSNPASKRFTASESRLTVRWNTTALKVTSRATRTWTRFSSLGRLSAKQGAEE